MPNKGIKELYFGNLKDLYDAENLQLKALFKMAKAASATELRQRFEEHLKQTLGHEQRLGQIFNSLDESPKGQWAWRG